MLESARRVAGGRADYAVADAQELPFAYGAFDVVIANHVLYHVPDRRRAFAELARVLATGGALHASTIGRGHLQELQDLVPDWDFEVHTEAFGLETGAEQLAPLFTEIRVERYEDAPLVVTEVEPVLAYIRSSNTYRGQPLDAARAVVETAIARDGAFRIQKRLGLISARKA
jgi:ubiquinone/menaquinone biosynthesis C-methylase UbiE